MPAFFLPIPAAGVPCALGGRLLHTSTAAVALVWTALLVRGRSVLDMDADDDGIISGIRRRAALTAIRWRCWT